MMPTIIYFNGAAFPPSFGYLEAWFVGENINTENPTWNVVLQFDATSNFSFSTFNVGFDELKEAIMIKITPLLGPPQLPAFEFPEDEETAAIGIG